MDLNQFKIAIELNQINEIIEFILSNTEFANIKPHKPYLAALFDILTLLQSRAAVLSENIGLTDNPEIEKVIDKYYELSYKIDERLPY